MNEPVLNPVIRTAQPNPIAQELRDWMDGPRYPAGPLMERAADEIERLVKENERLAEERGLRR
jgi:hypothetical protein